MSQKHESAPAKSDKDGAREMMLHALRVAAARSRLATNLFDSIGVSLRHRSIDVEGAMAWLKDEGFLEAVDFRPPPGGRK